MDSVGQLGTIMSVWAHPDDETYLAGGVMSAAVDNGQRVVCVSASAGERGTDDPIAWPPERLGRVRRWEAAAAMAVLGVREHHFLDLPDGSLADVDAAIAVDRLAGLIAEVAPDTILTFGPDGITYHPDHQAVSRWMDLAWDRAGRPGRLLHSAVSAAHLKKWSSQYEDWQVYMTDERPEGVEPELMAFNLVCEGPALDRKIAALAAMHTQTDRAMALLGAAAYRQLNAEECFVEAPTPRLNLKLQP